MEGLRQTLTIGVVLGFIGLNLVAASVPDPESSFFYYQQSDYPKDCFDIYDNCDSSDTVKNGVYYIKPEGLQDPIEVYCDHDDGGWTVIQRREDGTIDFARNSTYYKDGFGFPHKELWMGNELLAYLTNQRKYQLKIDMVDTRDRVSNVTYDWFRISDEKSGFQLVRLSDFSSSTGATDRMRSQGNGTFFGSEDDCSGLSGWWYRDGTCSGANLNGPYNEASQFKWSSHLMKTTMKVRPQPPSDA